MLGITPASWNIEQDVTGLDNWAGKRSSLVGLFLHFSNTDTPRTFPYLLDGVRGQGYTPFINLMGNLPMREYADGGQDAQIRALAASYAGWAKGKDKPLAYFAPFPEMNGPWYVFGSDPVNFKLAYQRIRNIFDEELSREGVSPRAARWAFAPDGRFQDQFEGYYPGDNLTDVLAFSSYNYGYCPSIHPWEKWFTPEEAFVPVIERMRAMAPTKGIFIVQTATTARTASGWNDNAKNDWLRTAYDLLVVDPSVKAMIYFNIEMDCDWLIYTDDGLEYDGYREAVQNSGYGYISPAELYDLDLTPQLP
jgi:hypothetical protein